MSEYFLADHKAAERDQQRQRERERDSSRTPKAAGIKATLLGDFMATAAPQGCDPYNSTQGKPVQDAWSRRHARR